MILQMLYNSVRASLPSFVCFFFWEKFHTNHTNHLSSTNRNCSSNPWHRTLRACLQTCFICEGRVPKDPKKMRWCYRGVWGYNVCGGGFFTEVLYLSLCGWTKIPATVKASHHNISGRKRICRISTSGRPRHYDEYFHTLISGAAA